MDESSYSQNGIVRLTELNSLQDDIAEKRRLNISFATFLIGSLLIIAAIWSVANLQTSINVEGGLGATTLFVYAGSSIVGGLFVFPIFLQFFSIKTAMVLGDIGLFMIVPANFFPEYFTLLPGAAMFGLGRSGFWICSGLFIVYYAKQYDMRGGKAFREYFSIVNALYFCAYQSSQIFGNLIPFSIFRIGLLYQSDKVNNDATNATTSNSISSLTIQHKENWSIDQICGANDCQDPSVTNQNLSNYRPPSKEAYYIAISVVAAVGLIGIFLHATFAPHVVGVDVLPHDDEKLVKTKANGTLNGETDKNNYIYKERKFHNNYSSDNKLEETNQTVYHQTSALTSPAEDLLFDTQGLCHQIKENLRQFFKPNQLLLMALQLQAGMGFAFVNGEVTRAFVSCAFGVGQVGISMSIYGASSLVFSVITGKLSGKFGRKYAVALGFFSSVSLYLFCLFWIPNENSSFGIAVALLVVCGLVDAVMLTISSEVTLAHFPEQRRRAYSCWLVWSSAGMLLQYAWSTSLCVRYKIYVMFCTLVLSVVTYGVAERIYMQKRRGN